MKFSLLILTSILCCFSTIATRVAMPNDAPRPNMVIILVDDLRYDTFGYMGHPFLETPHIDALAREGLQFTRAFVTTSLCSPSRASFLTGRYMHNHGVVDNAQAMSRAIVTFPYLLQESGYHTAFIGKWHMGGSSDAPRPGFDHWVSFRGQGTYAAAGKTLNVNGKQVPRRIYMTDELSDYAVDWVAEQSPDAPFLLYLSHKGVHGLYDPAPRHRNLYQGEHFAAPTSMNSPEDAGDKPMWVRDQRNSWHGVEFPYHGRSGQSIAEMYKHYCEMILSIDDSVGRVVDVLRDRGFERDTLILFTSDGGHLWGEHGLIDKRCAYEESIRIPMLAKYPSMIRPGSSCDALVANIDLAPTLLELAGIPIPEGVDGRSLVGLLKSPSDEIKSWRETLLYEYYWEPSFPQTPTMFALRGERYKFIQYHGIWDSDELYDLVEDPGEMHNLIRKPEQRDRVTEFRQQLYQRLEASGGLAIPLGFKRGGGANLRDPAGSKRARFPAHMLAPQTDD